jgi:hypothetical protein
VPAAPAGLRPKSRRCRALAALTVRLDALLRRDPQRAKVEILKHLDGDLVIVPRPSSTGERRAEISGRAKANSLLRDQEAKSLGGRSLSEDSGLDELEQVTVDPVLLCCAHTVRRAFVDLESPSGMDVGMTWKYENRTGKSGGIPFPGGGSFKHMIHPHQLLTLKSLARLITSSDVVGYSHADDPFTVERRRDQALLRKLRRRCCAQRSMRRSMGSANRTG